MKRRRCKPKRSGTRTSIVYANRLHLKKKQRRPDTDEPRIKVRAGGKRGHSGFFCDGATEANSPGITPRTTPTLSRRGCGRPHDCPTWSAAVRSCLFRAIPTENPRGNLLLLVSAADTELRNRGSSPSNLHTWSFEAVLSRQYSPPGLGVTSTRTANPC